MTWKIVGASEVSVLYISIDELVVEPYRDQEGWPTKHVEIF